MVVSIAGGRKLGSVAAESLQPRLYHTGAHEFLNGSDLWQSKVSVRSMANRDKRAGNHQVACNTSSIFEGSPPIMRRILNIFVESSGDDKMS